MSQPSVIASDLVGASTPAPLGLLEVVGCGIWTYDGEDTRFVNRAMAEITGYTCEELLQPNFFAGLVHPDDRDMIVERGKARVRGENPPEHYEIRIIHRSGEVRHLALHARLLELPEGPVSVVSAIDVSSQKAAEQAFRDGAARVFEFLDSVPAHVITTNATGKPTWVNQHWLSFTGQTLEEAMEAGTAPLIHPDDLAQATREWLSALRSGKGYDIEYRVRNRHGEFRWTQFRIRPLRDAAGTLTGWTSASVDVHESAELRLALQTANAQLEEAVRAKDEVLGLISHELRTPLTTLLGNAQVLRRRGEALSPEDRLAVAMDLEADATRLNAVIQNMLVLSRAGSEAEVEVEPVRVERLAAGVIADFEARGHSQAVVLHSCEVPLAAANPTYFQQILGNLLTNAAKYSPPQSTIEVRITAGDDCVVTSVIDEGPGIPEAELAQVFSPFFRSAQHSSVYGIGLGLTVCQRLAEIQRGTVRVQNREAGGCEFAFTLPLAGAIAED